MEPCFSYKTIESTRTEVEFQSDTKKYNLSRSLLYTNSVVNLTKAKINIRNRNPEWVFTIRKPNLHLLSGPCLSLIHI